MKLINKIKPFSFEEKIDFMKRYVKTKKKEGAKINLFNQAENVWNNYRLQSFVSVKTNENEYYIF